MFKKTINASILMAIASSAFAAPTLEEQWKIIEQQQAEIEALKDKQSETEAQLEATADALDSQSGGASWATKTSLGGYGEHHYNNKQNGGDMVDAHRFVLFVNHEYSDTIKFFSELELEHSLAGEGKPGEIELEQAYIQWQFSQNHQLNMGQFLIPVGILNETHEPETFYGVERNPIEKDIIPSTWWETGLMMSGRLAPALSYDLAVHSGLNTSVDSSIRSGRQKSAKAVAEKFGYTARLKYTGFQGLELAATFQFQEDMSQGEAADQEAGTLLEAHAAYLSGPFSLRVLYAQWQIDGEAYIDAEGSNQGKDEQFGFYFEPGYKLTDKLGVFARYNVWNNQAGSSDAEDKEAIDVGLNYWLHPRVVMKTDYQVGQSDNVGDTFNLGLGWSF